MRSRSSNSIWLGACSSTTVSEANTMRPALVVRSRTSEQVRSGSRRFARSTGRSFFRAYQKLYSAWRRHGDCCKHSSRASVHAGSQERSLLLNPDGLEWRATRRLIGRLIQIALPKTAWSQNTPAATRAKLQLTRRRRRRGAKNGDGIDDRNIG